MTANARHEVGSDRKKVTHQEFVCYLLECARKFGKSNGPEWTKGLVERAGMVARQRECDCEICNPSREGVDA